MIIMFVCFIVNLKGNILFRFSRVISEFFMIQLYVDSIFSLLIKSLIIAIDNLLWIFI